MLHTLFIGELGSVLYSVDSDFRVRGRGDTGAYILQQLGESSAIGYRRNISAEISRLDIGGLT